MYSIHIDSRTVTYAMYGSPKMERVAFYLNGFGTCHLEGSFLDESAKRIGVTILAVNRPGVCGSSSDADTTIHSMAPVLEAISSRYNIEKYGLIGLSGGAPYALAAASELSQAVSICLVMSGAGEFARPEVCGCMAQPYRAWLRFARDYPVVSEIVLSSIWVLWRTVPRQIFQLFRRGLSFSDQAILNNSRHASDFLECIRMGFANRNAVFKELQLLVSPWEIDFSRITAPVHFFHGTTDAFVPLSVANDSVKRLGRGTLSAINDGGHFMALTMSDTICTEIAHALP